MTKEELINLHQAWLRRSMNKNKRTIAKFETLKDQAQIHATMNILDYQKREIENHQGAIKLLETLS